MRTGRQEKIHAEPDRKLEAARKQRQLRCQQAALTFGSCPLGVVLPVMGSSNRTSPRVRSLNFPFADQPDTHSEACISEQADTVRGGTWMTFVPTPWKRIPPAPLAGLPTDRVVGDLRKWSHLAISGLRTVAGQLSTNSSGGTAGSPSGRTRTRKRWPSLDG